MRMPVHGRSGSALFRTVTASLGLLRHESIIQAIPKPNLALRVARGKVRFRRVERETGQALVGNVLGEAIADLVHSRNMHFSVADDHKPFSVR